MKKLLMTLSVICYANSFAQNTCATHSPVFNGLTSYITAGNSNSFIGTSGTFEAWINVTSFNQSYLQIVGQSSANTGIEQFAFYIDHTNNDVLVMQNRNAGNTSWFIVTGVTSITTGKWYHVACTWETNGGTGYITTANLYVNGCLDGTNSPSNTAWGTNTSYPVCIGGWDWNINSNSSHNGYAFDGLIDEARIWSVARSQCQIIDNMEQLDFFGADHANLLCYYQFNEGSLPLSPAQTQDSFNGSNNGTLNNINTWSTSSAPVISYNSAYYAVGGTSGCTPSFNNPYSLHFNGSNNYISVGGYNTGASGTVEAWIYVSSYNHKYMQIFGQSSTTNGLEQFLFYIDHTNGNVLTLQNRNPGNTAWFVLTGASAIATGEWYHVAATWNTNGGTGYITDANIYINGCLDVSNSPASTQWGTNQTKPLCVGGWDWNVDFNSSFDGYVFNGFIDEVKVWNAARSKCEIVSNMYNSVPATYPASLQIYYPFDNNTNDVASGFNGTLSTSAPTFSTTTVAPINPTCNGTNCRAMSIQTLAHTQTVNAMVFPNPSNETPNILLNSLETQNTEISVYNYTGSIITKSTVVATQGESIHPVATYNLPNGFYICSVVLNNGGKYISFVINK